ncbi:MAG: cysteine desulfurase [Flavobacteriales bacterium]|nr:cysteine desulfurase [Flavobacteriales bacterium]MDW8432036.1 cysteine desulfurase family protein [Flavobacteriales bacterium]
MKTHPRIYLDNAATTPLDPEVAAVMKEVMDRCFGNPSSTHAFGREARTLVERARKTMAELMGCSPGEICFTSGGTEADNMILRTVVRAGQVRKIITSPLEHHAVLHTVEELHEKDGVEVVFLPTDTEGRPDLNFLEKELHHDGNRTLVSLMHANNEIGTMINLAEVGYLARQHGAHFHSDTVQTVGHYSLTFKDLPLDFAAASAHKFHGPKGVGFAYLRGGKACGPLITGGAQERNLRAGTENVYGIVGMAKALELALSARADHENHIRSLKNRALEKIRENIPEAEFNGDISEDSLYTVLNVLLPEFPDPDMLLFRLDIEGLAVSGGSACSSGSHKGSHVIRALGKSSQRPSVRLSFSRMNTMEEVDCAVDILARVVHNAPQPHFS